jgi:hypothetical protein
VASLFSQIVRGGPITKALHVANMVPGVNLISGPVTAAMGAGELALGALGSLVPATSRLGAAYATAGLKELALGAAAPVPVLGQIANGYALTDDFTPAD